MEMKELVSPEQSEFYVNMASLALLLIGGLCGYRAIGVRGLLAGLTGPLVWGMWRFHAWITRYDPQTGYFGLDKVKVLLLEVVLFVGVGIVLGLVWSALSNSYRKQNQLGES